MSRGRLLIVDDDPVTLNRLADALGDAGYDVAVAEDGGNAIALLEHTDIEVVLTEQAMGLIDGLQVLQRCRELRPDAEVVMITANASLSAAVATVKLGAFDYLAKPPDLDALRRIVGAAVEKVRLKRLSAAFKPPPAAAAAGEVAIVTRDPEMERLLALARQIAPTDCTVLITGESGTGKELFARYIHRHSGRWGGPFVAVNCGAFNQELLASELFGHERGAFTGATGVKKGLIEIASGGTLFLDEVTEMAPAMQVKLLRVVQEREIMRVGGTGTIKVDVRFVAATNRDTAEEVRAGRFRQDLYFRLNVVNLHVPPLNVRQGDVPLLAHYFLREFAIMMRRPVSEISDAAMALLQDHDYPGNVRELRNAIERAVAVAPDAVVEPQHLPDPLRHHRTRLFRRGSEGALPSLQDQEKDYIRWVLVQTNGNQTAAARILGIDRVSLWRKLKRYDMAAGPSLPPTK